MRDVMVLVVMLACAGAAGAEGFGLAGARGAGEAAGGMPATGRADLAEAREMGEPGVAMPGAAVVVDPAMRGALVIGLTGPVGPVGEPKRARMLRITEPGVYENYLVDAEWREMDAVRITADNVTLRNSEIRNCQLDGIEVYASDVLIENCRIHYLLKGTFKEQADAHGITGQPRRLTIRNCEIGYMSGDCIQFDPDREPWGDVLIENCRLFTGPLPIDAAGYKKGEWPGENAVDTKQLQLHPRSKMTIRNCVLEGFAKNGPIPNRAALNLKNNIEAVVENCVFKDNEIALRLRGSGSWGAGMFGGAHVRVADCFVSHADLAYFAEHRPEQLSIARPRFGPAVRRKFRGRPGEGYQISEEDAEAMKR